MGADVAISYSSRAESGEKNAKDLAEKYGVKSKAYKCQVADFKVHYLPTLFKTAATPC